MKRLFLLLLLTAPASASELIFLNPGNQQSQPGRIEFSTPEGAVCRRTASRRTELVVGGSYGRGSVLSGDVTSNQFNTFQEGATMSDGVPTVGVAIRIPLGSDDLGSCQGMITVLDASTRVDTAERMFQNGLITQEELEKVASRAYSILSDF